MFKAFKRLFTGNVETKALTEMRHSGGISPWIMKLPRTKFDYKGDVGTGVGSSTIMGPVQWIQRAFSESPIIVTRKVKDEFEVVPDHPLTQLLKNPNKFYSGTDLFWASIYSWAIPGNVYWLIVQGKNTGRPLELWWEPSWSITPKAPQDGSAFLTHYEYKTSGKTQRIKPEDIVHIRHGIDPANPMLGISPLNSVMREIWTDDEASNFVAALLRNSGVPSVVISPDSDAVISTDEADVVKKYFQDMFTGDRRGNTAVMTTKTKVSPFGFSPQKLDLSATRNVTEERVCVNLGIPAAVVGFGTGMQQTKVGATMTELRKLAWLNGIIPLQKLFADTIGRSLLPLFESRPEMFRVEFDRSEVQALQADMTELAKQADIGVKGGWMTVAEARAMTNLPVEDHHKVFIRGFAVVEVPDNATPRPVAPPDPAKGNGLDHEYKRTAPEGSDTAEARAIENAPRGKPSDRDIRLVDTLEKAETVHAERFASVLVKTFNELGDLVAEVAEDAFKGLVFAHIKGQTSTYQYFPAGNSITKAADEAIDAARIIDRVVFDSVNEQMKAGYAAHYNAVVVDTFEISSEVLGVATNLPDPVAIRILQTSGTRAGLVDLSKQAKDTLFNVLVQAREDGLAGEAIARRIRTEIPKGRFKDVNTRAKLIARTETKFAQNESMMEFAKEVGAERAMIFDARGGETDATCEALNGLIVSVEEARALVSEEHPNGTRSFTPILE